jgi:hypothetical protein
MHTITLNKTHTTLSGSLHVQVSIDGKDSGVLYLTPNEAELLLKIIQRGVDVTENKCISDIYSDSCFDGIDNWELEE